MSARKDSEDEQGKGISWDTSVGTMGAEFVLTQNTAEPPILIVMRGYSKGGSWGVRFSFLLARALTSKRQDRANKR